MLSLGGLWEHCLGEPSELVYSEWPTLMFWLVGSFYDPFGPKYMSTTSRATSHCNSMNIRSHFGRSNKLPWQLSAQGEGQTMACNGGKVLLVVSVQSGISLVTWPIMGAMLWPANSPTPQNILYKYLLYGGAPLGGGTKMIKVVWKSLRCNEIKKGTWRARDGYIYLYIDISISICICISIDVYICIYIYIYIFI